MSGNSLQDQLRKAGLANDKNGKNSKQNKSVWGKVSRPSKKQRQESQQQSTTQQAAEKARAEQAARADALNRERQAAAKRRASQAEIRQIIDSKAIQQPENGEPYHFSDQGKVQSVLVDTRLRDQLASGHCRLVRFNEQYHVLPKEAAEKVAQRDSDCLVAQSTNDNDSGYDDPRYQVPDDLIW